MRKREVEKQNGNVDEAFKTAAKVIEAEYEWPFQSHASMGPACALVEIKDGKVTCWTGTQKPHFVQHGVAATLGLPVEKVHVIWTTGPGLLRPQRRRRRGDGRRRAGEGGRQAGAVQYMRDEGTGWDPKGPASVHRARAALDAAGQRHRLRVHQQGLLARRRRTPTAASRATRWPARPAASR